MIVNKSNQHELILAIESSCDETSAALYDTHKGLLSNIVYSQTSEDLHCKFGGVVPELASRSHIEKIDSVVAQALDNGNVTLQDITTIGVTSKPGLPGSLLVGACFAKAIAGTLNKKIIAIDHLEGHVFSACVENKIPFPFLCITASGGHTSTYFVEDFGIYTRIGTTHDDAAGEAFDKIAKLLCLGYPGGPLIEKRAASINFVDFFSYPRGNPKLLDFSFSGIKTAVLYDMVKRNAYDLNTKTLLDTSDDFKNKVCSSLQVAIADIFKHKVIASLKLYPHVKALAFVGGVACNAYIRSELKKLSIAHTISFFTPTPLMCTDNAGMIAFVTHYKAQQDKFSDLSFDIL